jgi:lysyl-tRNA synthetase class 2
MSDDQNTHHQAFYENRYKTIKALRETKNPDPYPHKFHVTHGVPKFIEEFGAEGKLKNGDVIQSAKPVGLILFVHCEAVADWQVTLAGRVQTIRDQGAKLRFYDIRADGQKIQIMCSAA